MICSCAGVSHENVVTPLPRSIEYSAGTCLRRDAKLEFRQDASLAEEAYKIKIGRRKIIISYGSESGRFYALQTLSQLEHAYHGEIPCQRISDHPRFPYRGVMLDVSRHFFDADFIIKQLKLWSKLKINRFHWHLTDGTAWRLEIDGYPLLTRGLDGFYTKDDVRRVLAVADSLHISVIPEIEMFGHSEEVQRVYPQFFCFGSRVKSSEYCIGKEETFRFLEDVLGQVMELFPSEYIHIGGDEAGKGNWEKCPDCRKRMNDNALASTDQLQSYGISRIADFVHSRGRKIIGWDEIMEGGLADGAVVMSWRGTDGGKEAARMGHKAIMTPGRYCYINNAQDDPRSEPASQGGYLPLEKVYGYDPALGMDTPGNILGLQANLWTEYVATEQHMEYMLYPRVFAVAEVGWSPQESRNYGNFRSRCLNLLTDIRKKSYFCFDLGNEKGERKEALEQQENLAKGCAVAYNACAPHPQYPGEGESTLTNGLWGSWDCSSGWQGFLDCDVDITVDLGRLQSIHSVKAGFGEWDPLWIWLPKSVSVLISADGKEFRKLAEVEVPGNDSLVPEFVQLGWDSGEEEARYVRLTARKNGHEGGWIFMDEITIL